MLRANGGWSDRVVPRWAYGLVAVAIAAVAVVTTLGRHDQRDRQIENVVSATVTKTNPQLHRTQGPVTLDKSQATALAEQLNSLPKPFHVPVNCPNDDGSTFDIRFTTKAGSIEDVTVDATGCSNVSLNASNWNRTDRNGTVRAVLTKDLTRS